MNQGWEKIAMKKKIHYKIVFVKYTIILIIKKFKMYSKIELKNLVC